MEAARLFIVRRIVPEDRGHATPCWMWQGPKNEKGYGRTEFNGVRHVRVHRLSYESYVGPIPDGLQIDHLCSVTGCVNPNHLEAVSGDENRRRQTLRNGHTIGGSSRLTRAKRPGVGSGGWQRYLTHCKRGHEYTPANTIMCDDARRCLTCRTAARAIQNIKKREERAVARANSSAGVGSHRAHATANSRTGVALTHPDTATRL